MIICFKLCHFTDKKLKPEVVTNEFPQAKHMKFPRNNQMAFFNRTKSNLCSLLTNSIHIPRFTSNLTLLLGFCIMYTPSYLDSSTMYYLYKAFDMQYTKKSFIDILLTATIKYSSNGQYLYNFSLILSRTVCVQKALKEHLKLNEMSFKPLN